MTTGRVLANFGIVLVALIGLLASPILWVLAEPLVAHVLPKPPIVPSKATSYSDWKGFGGVAWTWCVATPTGRVIWNAADHGRRAVLMLATNPRCPALPSSNSADPSDVFYWSGDPTITFQSADALKSMEGAGVPCGFAVSHERIKEYSRVVRDALSTSENTVQRQMLASFRDQLATTDGTALTADAAGGHYCTNGPRWRVKG